ncbi:MAG: glycosyltransferase family 2 protein [Gemmatimonadota bacterium]
MVFFLIPAYDEERTVGLLLYKLRKVMEDVRRRYVVLVLDDGSNDGTAEHVESYKRLVPVLLFRHGSNRGYGVALDRLIREACRMSRVPERDVAITLDADFTVDPEPVPQMIREIEAGADLVIGSTLAPQGKAERAPLRSRMFSKVLPLIYRSVQPVGGVADYASSFRAYRIALLKRGLREFQEGLVSSPGRAAGAQLLLRLGALAPAVKEIPVKSRYDIRTRPSRFRLRKSVREHWRLGSAPSPGGAR